MASLNLRAGAYRMMGAVARGIYHIDSIKRL